MATEESERENKKSIQRLLAEFANNTLLKKDLLLEWHEILVNANIMVILCGSLVSMMVHQTLSYSSPLYGRRTGQIRMKQIAFKNYHLFFDEKGNYDLIAHYSVNRRRSKIY
jgi:AAA+ ATPase superfamily predicted ATPase